MRLGGGSQKGSAFERKVCRQLSHWLSGGKREDLFWRSAMSGGRATLGLKKGMVRATQAGDVTAIDGKGLGAQFLKQFVVECKHVKSLDLDKAVAKQTGAFVKYWAKHLGEARAHSRSPFLVARQNRFPTLLFLDMDGAEHFALLDFTHNPVLGVLKSPSLVTAIYVIDFEWFLENWHSNV